MRPCDIPGCTRSMRRDLFLRTCWSHARAETRYILGKMVESKVVGKDPKR